jgi:hypothetical protein
MAARTMPVDDVSRAVAALLTQLGFVKRTEDIYTKSLRGDVLGWIGLNRAVARGDGRLEINPVVGVRHQRVERLVADLADRKYHQYIPPTASLHLGYLMPDRRYIPWLFTGDTNVASTARLMIEAVTLFGVPFMVRNSALPELADTLKSGTVGTPDHLAYRLPVVLFLLHDIAGAQDVLDRAEAALGDRQDAAALALRSYASRMRGSFAEQPSG